MSAQEQDDFAAIAKPLPTGKSAKAPAAEADDFAAIAHPADITQNDNSEGTYEMESPTAGKIKIPYSKIGDAAKAGYKMSSTDRKRYLTDAAADKNLNKDKNLPEGVRVAGKNSAGQDILTPTSPTDGSALSRFAKAEYGGLKDAVKGVGAFLNPNTSEEEKKAGRTSTFDILMRYPERAIQPNADMAEQATREAQSGDYSAAAEHGIGAAIPLAGPFMAGAVDKGAQAIAGGNYAGAAGGAVADVMAAEAPGVGWELGKGAMRGIRTMSPKSLGGAFVDTVTRTGPREVKRLAEHTEKENADAITAANKVNDDRAEKHLGKTIDAVQEAHKHAQKEGFRSDEVDRENELNRQIFNKSELERVKKEGEDRLEALKKNKDKIANYEERRDAIRKENEANYRAQISEQNIHGELKTATDALETQYDKASENAKKQYNSTWNTWRNSVKNVTTDMTPTVDVINAQEKSMDPQQVSIFKQILSETAPENVGTSPEVAEANLNDLVAKKILAGGYKQALDGTLERGVAPDVISLFHDLADKTGINRDAAKAAQQANASLTEVPAERLHTWKSQLERAVRSTKDGTIRYAIGKVLDQVRKQETDATAQAGPKAVKQLAKARSITGPYFDAFLKEEADLPSVAGKSLREQSPLAKDRGAEERLNNIARYNPELAAAAKKVAKLSENLEKLRKKRDIGKRSELPLSPEGSTMTPEGVKLNRNHASIPARAIPTAQFESKPFEPKPGGKSTVAPDRPIDKPADTTTLSREDLKNWKKNNLSATAQRIRDLALSRSLYAAMTGIPISIATLMMGHPIYAVMEASSPASVIAFSSAVANLLEKPGTVEYLSRVTNKDIAAYEKLPPKEKALFKEDMGKLTEQAKKQGATISPELSAFIASPTVQPRKKKPTPRELLDEAHRTLGSNMYQSGYGGNSQ